MGQYCNCSFSKLASHSGFGSNHHHTNIQVMKPDAKASVNRLRVGSVRKMERIGIIKLSKIDYPCPLFHCFSRYRASQPSGIDMSKYNVAVARPISKY